MKTRIKIAFLLLACQLCFSQRLDSLKIALKEASSDTTRCKILNAVIEAPETDTLWPHYNDELLRISENNLKTCPPKLRKFYSGYYALALNNLGYLKMSLGNGPEAIEYYSRALKIQQSIGDKTNSAVSLINMGYLLRQQGNISKALDTYHSALKLLIETNDRSQTATCYNNIAFIFETQKEYKKALEYYERSLKIYKEINAKDGIGTCYLNLAYFYKTNGDPHCNDIDIRCKKLGYTKAISYLRSSIAIFLKLNDKQQLASCYNMLGGIYDLYGDPECIGTEVECKNASRKKAFDFYEKALQLRVELKNISGISQSYNSLAKHLFKKGDLTKALQYANYSMAAAQELGSPQHIMDAALILKEIYSKLNKTTDCLKMFELYIQMKDSINNEETKNTAIKKGFQIEYEKKAAADSVLVAEEKKVVAAELEEEKTKRFALYGGLALVIIFSVFMVNRFIVTNKQKKIIENKEREALMQNIIINEQKQIVEEKQKEMLDSIHYAKRIQTALIANTKFINENIDNNFVYFNPKDIVSGDFYWATLHNDKFYLAVCDSTGHGVPGAFMSLLNMGFLSEAIKEKNIDKPNEIFDYVRERLINSISSEGQKDGMDGILLCIDKKKGTYTYAAANNEPILVRNNTVIELEKDKMPVGKGERTDKFTLHTLDLQKGDSLYLYTDGFADQFGGPKGKKFKYKQLNELLQNLMTLPLHEQRTSLENTFKEWKGSLEQVDDVLIMGIKV